MSSNLCGRQRGPFCSSIESWRPLKYSWLDDQLQVSFTPKTRYSICLDYTDSSMGSHSYFVPDATISESKRFKRVIKLDGQE